MPGTLTYLRGVKMGRSPIVDDPEGKAVTARREAEQAQECDRNRYPSWRNARVLRRCGIASAEGGVLIIAFPYGSNASKVLAGLGCTRKLEVCCLRSSHEPACSIGSGLRPEKYRDPA